MTRRARLWWPDRPARDPDPPPRDSTRRPCPSCGIPDAEVLFQSAACSNGFTPCRNYDPRLVLSCPEAERAVSEWLWALSQREG